jgi:tRNA-dihydrouridine synthase 2
MNGDVASREQAQELISEFGVDGAMIATAAEANPSCFRTKAEGGLAPWREVVPLYLKKAMEVENRWGNTKYLLGHLIPGKDPIYRGVTATKSYSDVCELLGLQELLRFAKLTDERLEIGVDKSKGMSNQAKRKNQNQLAGSDSVGIKRKRSIEKDCSIRNIQVQYPALALSV